MTTSHELPPGFSPAQRYGLLLVALAAVAPNLVGSAFNIAYNQIQIEPMLKPHQLDRFGACWRLFNLVIYPIGVLVLATPLLWVEPVHRALVAGRPVEPRSLLYAQRFAVNLPWWVLRIVSVCWLICIPVFGAALLLGDEPVDREVLWHLATSFVIAGMIAVTQCFFAVELASQRLLFPVYFQHDLPCDTPGAYPLSITGRGLMFGVSAVASPIIALVLLLVLPEASRQTPEFGLSVGAVAIAFGLTTAWMLGRLVALPVRRLKDAAVRVAEGDLDVRVDDLRADDFGPLIDRFNRMVEGLRERERLQETFGRHVGHEAARQILARGAGLGGTEMIVTVMFVDVRDFTAHSSRHDPDEVVSVLNIFFREAVETIESHGGMVNKFLGDGLMALFGVSGGSENHALAAVRAATAMQERLRSATRELEQAGWPGLRIGIGVNTGPAIVGSIGSPRRQEFTAIGDTVNIASRVETLTKPLARCLLITEATRLRLPADFPIEALPPQWVKGREEPIAVFAPTSDSPLAAGQCD
ncbi:Adenylate cyclase 1 [Pirellulimonas nuda]|uniref:Adenylate cyclase 1 n=1 Tax=Pirellulimonas nuda TaxID=2528009 RepID=A0A518D7Z9_9BACT|nr:adenylate/guanylate cyclase domain-containing protein [Pirellulimonas nuda]QDU87583.1 Adenylate cyclase 1 [Pirellulimonas nuda]